MKRLAVILLAGLLLVSGCSASEAKPVLVPVTLSLNYNFLVPAKLKSGQTVEITESVYNAGVFDPITVGFSASGTIQAVGESKTTFSNVALNDTVQATGKFKTTGSFGPGQIRAGVFVTLNGAPASSEANSLDVYVAPEEVLIGKTGIYALRRKHLLHLLLRGRLSYRQYKEELLNLSRVPFVPDQYLP